MSDEHEDKSEDILADTPPWLQPISSEDEVEELDVAGSFGKVKLFVAIVLVIGFAGGLYYVYKMGAGVTTVAPRHVAAPKTAFKSKPEAPGGMKIPDQDKRVFTRIEGNGDDAQVAMGNQPEEPAEEIPDTSASDIVETTKEEPTQKIVEKPEIKVATRSASKQVPQKLTMGTKGKGIYRVQLGAYGSTKSANAAWKAIKDKYPSIIEGLDISPLEAVHVSNRSLYRLRIGPIADRTGADKICLAFRAKSQNCMVVNP